MLVQKSLLEPFRTEAVSNGRRSGYEPASVVQQWAVTKGPGRDRAGGVTFRPRGGVKLRSVRKHCLLPAALRDAASARGWSEEPRRGKVLRPSGCLVGPPAHNGDFTDQRKSHAVPAAPSGGTTPSHKPMAKRTAHAAARSSGFTGVRLGMAASPE